MALLTWPDTRVHYAKMTPITHIRTKLFELTQAAFAEIAGATQPTVCRWESGELEPGRDNLEKIRNAALQRGLDWNDRFFFEVPTLPDEQQVPRLAS